MDINTLTIVDNIMTANFSPSVFSAAMYFGVYSHDEKLYLKLDTGLQAVGLTKSVTRSQNKWI